MTFAKIPDDFFRQSEKRVGRPETPEDIEVGS